MPQHYLNKAEVVFIVNKPKRNKKINLTKQIDTTNLKYNYIIGTTNRYFILKLFR